MNVSTSAVDTAPAPTRNFRWRVVDIVVASVIGVASGLVFLLWNIAYRGPSALLEPLLPGLQGLLDGPWLFAGVLGALIIRKPGAAIYTEVIAAAVSAITLIGNTWGAALTIEAGLVQGLGAELVFLLFAYRLLEPSRRDARGCGRRARGRDQQPRALVRGRRSRASPSPTSSAPSISGALIAGALPWVLTRGLASTGALDRFASGREARARV